MDNKDTSIILSREQRANLWRGDGIPVDWAWVYDNSEASWAGFRDNLVKEIKKDRIDVKFIVLFGPDAITAAGGYNPTCWDCADAITSDISRSVDFRYPNSLRQLAGCTPWERLTYDRARLEEQIQAKHRGKQDSVIEQELATAFHKMNSISVCRQQRAKPKGIIRFLPCNLDQRPADPPSSTKIREIVESSPQEEWEKNLEGVALHPKILVKYLNERPPRPKPIKPAEPKEDLEKDDREKKRWDSNIVW
ncbi:hypothetical protein F53441_14446 [Fusarium austroafricanum]|uniref:Uncharacterized protein n=1 Tax=Fusarium austroafricanum TaxID=2364996 RepID=A0A8H4JDX1_9HYPO|nr:hypothetical protein F53441_14446 [Fusarium austroafricanum]